MLHNIRAPTNRSLTLHLSSHAEYLQAIWHFLSESPEGAIWQKHHIEIPEDTICCVACVCVLCSFAVERTVLKLCSDLHLLAECRAG